MRLIASKKICEEFYLTYELKGAQKAVDILSRYYGIRKMKIIVDGRRVGNSYEACYNDNFAYFKKRGLNKRNVLHKFYHHLVNVFNWDMIIKLEERRANSYVSVLMKKALK